MLRVGVCVFFFLRNQTVQSLFHSGRVASRQPFLPAPFGVFDLLFSPHIHTTSAHNFNVNFNFVFHTRITFMAKIMPNTVYALAFSPPCSSVWDVCIYSLTYVKVIFSGVFIHTWELLGECRPRVVQLVVDYLLLPFSLQPAANKRLQLIRQ